MKKRTFEGQAWCKVIALAFVGFSLMLLPDWGSELLAQTVIPNAVDDTAITAAETPVGIDVLANDTTSPAGIPLIITDVTSPSNGTTVISGSQVIYTPNPGFSGTDLFTYTIEPNLAGLPTIISDTATVTVQVLPPPVEAVDDSATTQAQTPVTIAVLANDTGTGIAVTAVGNPANGAAALNNDGTITYTPAANFAGDDTFTYTITDAFGQSDSATVTVTVLPPGLNAVDDTASTPAQTPVTIAVLANDTGTGIVLTQVDNPSNGTVTVNADSTVTYNPTPGSPERIPLPTPLPMPLARLIRHL
ncbi:MAG: cadherin-like domain-containing protein [Candidatus Competibacteraceae bacterium]|nr:cadherin-like domain-containing protein [Candidatus Competibacteraceae bacterium]